MRRSKSTDGVRHHTACQGQDRIRPAPDGLAHRQGKILGIEGFLKKMLNHHGLLPAGQG
jgi:hypothetical protein